MATLVIGGTLATGLPAHRYYKVTRRIDPNIKVFTIRRFGLGDLMKAAIELEWQVLAACDPGEENYLVGHSQGGVIAAIIAMRNPGRFRKVVSLFGPFKGARVTPRIGAPVCKYLSYGSPHITALWYEIGQVLGEKLVSIFSTRDRIAKPFWTGYVPGAVNILFATPDEYAEHAEHLPGVIHVATSHPPGHIDIGCRRVVRTICMALGRPIPEIPAPRAPIKQAVKAS